MDIWELGEITDHCRHSLHSCDSFKVIVYGGTGVVVIVVSLHIFLLQLALLSSAQVCDNKLKNFIDGDLLKIFPLRWLVMHESDASSL